MSEAKGFWVRFEPDTTGTMFQVREVFPVPSDTEINHMANNSCRDLFEVSETKFITGYHKGFKKALELMGYKK